MGIVTLSSQESKLLLQLNLSAVKMGEKQSAPPNLHKHDDLMLYWHLILLGKSYFFSYMETVGFLI